MPWAKIIIVIEKMSFSRMTLVILILLMVAAAVNGQPQKQRYRKVKSVAATDAAVASEAPTGFDNETNGLVVQTIHDQNREVFEQVEGIEEGLGPVFNGQSCRECHINPVSGASSQVSELRVAFSGQRRIEQSKRHRGIRLKNRGFAIGLGDEYADPDISINFGRDTIMARSLINDRAICPGNGFSSLSAQMNAPEDVTVRSNRMSLSILGDGFVEAIPDEAIERVAQEQCAGGDGICGQVNKVPVLEAPDTDLREVGRFGWKAQHASLLSFAADAYLNELGITNRLLPEEVTPVCDTVPDPEDEDDVDAFAEFMRATKAPPRHPYLAEQPDARIGSEIFEQIGCAGCHVATFVTAPVGSMIHGEMFEVSDALGNKIIHPYSDFLLHDVGTGDGIVQGDASTENKIRTPPLWGLHTRPRMMHDGASVTVTDAIGRHGGEAKRVAQRFFNLGPKEHEQVILFLKSL